MRVHRTMIESMIVARPLVPWKEGCYAMCVIYALRTRLGGRVPLATAAPPLVTRRAMQARHAGSSHNDDDDDDDDDGDDGDDDVVGAADDDDD